METTETSTVSKPSSTASRKSIVISAAITLAVAGVVMAGANAAKNYVDGGKASRVESMQRSISELGLEVSMATAETVSDGCRPSDWFKPASVTIIHDIHGKKSAVVLVCKDSSGVTELAAIPAIG